MAAMNRPRRPGGARAWRDALPVLRRTLAMALATVLPAVVAPPAAAQGEAPLRLRIVGGFGQLPQYT
jgi:hypothetical protein